MLTVTRKRRTRSVTTTSIGEDAGTAGARIAAATPEDLRLALRAATLYYLDGLTQAEIASRLGVSRPTAGRLVARAKANGMVASTSSSRQTCATICTPTRSVNSNAASD